MSLYPDFVVEAVLDWLYDVLSQN